MGFVASIAPRQVAVDVLAAGGEAGHRTEFGDREIFDYDHANVAGPGECSTFRLMTEADDVELVYSEPGQQPVSPRS